MKKYYPFRPPIEVNSATKRDDIFDAQLPSWVRDEMEKVAKKEKCSIKELKCKREIYFDLDDFSGWKDICEIIKE